MLPPVLHDFEHWFKKASNLCLKENVALCLNYPEIIIYMCTANARKHLASLWKHD